MPTWGNILHEVQAESNLLPNGTPDYDAIRRKYIHELHDLTGRDTFLYASAYLGPQSAQIHSEEVSITLSDVQGFMEVSSGVSSDQLDLIIHSPGGYAEAAESIMNYLRTRFSHIRAIIPLAAMSAATMMALGADEIVMGKHSQMGPIDPQITIATPEGPRGAPAKAILDQFELAKREIRDDPAALPVWLPILRGYSPGLLARCQDARNLSESIVANWLARYMFKNRDDAASKATAAAQWFADYSNFGSHSRGITVQQIEAAGINLNIKALEEDQNLQEAVISVYHASTITFNGTLAIKLIENQNDKLYATMNQARAVLQFKPDQQQQQARSRAARQNRTRGNRSKRKNKRRR